MAEPGLADKVVAIHEALRAAEVPHAFGGALALAYYAEPRATIDIDLNVFVPPARYDEVTGVLAPLGVGRTAPRSAVERDGQVRLWWGRNPVDVFFSYDAVHEAMQRDVRVVPFGDDTIPVLAPEHLLVAKAVFDRPKDWIDIEQMLLAVPVLDRAEVTRWLRHLLDPDDQRATRVAALWERVRGPDAPDAIDPDADPDPDAPGGAGRR